MKKYVLLLLVLVASSATAFAEKREDKWSKITENKEYLHGEGYGATLSEADNNALADLISKISTTVDSKSFQVAEETNAGGAVDSKEVFESTIKTYSQATLNNTEKIILKNEPDAHVGRYIKRSEITKIFESRKQKIKDLIECAQKADTRGKVDDALKYYYWALCLLKSVQNPNEMTYPDKDGNSHVLMNWIPLKMNDIFNELQTNVIGKDDNEVELFITYKGKPVSSLDYTYFDGRDWGNIYSAKDGRGTLELAAGHESDNYQIKYEYEYRGEARIDREIESVLNVVKGKGLPGAYTNVGCKVNKKIRSISEDIAKNFRTENTFGTNTDSVVIPTQLANSQKYAIVMERVLKAIRAKDYNGVSSDFTTEGFDIYTRLLNYGQAKIVGVPNMIYYPFDGGVVARGLQMSFKFKNGVRKSFVEDVVFTFNNNQKIENISFGLGKTAENDLLYKGIWPEETRKTIMSFLENYKTAFALKRLEYISTIFDDNAVIITAKEVKIAQKATVPENNRISMNGNKIIKYNKQNKRTYLKNLETCFNSNEFINIRFANNDVRRLNVGGELYEIQVAQDYYSSSYNDKGYLFLEVDFNTKEEPKIILRTWQPEKDPNFGLYGAKDF